MALGRPRELPVGRLELLWTFFWIMAVVYVARLVDLQLVRNEFYLKAAERNRTQMIFQTAPRGRIVDRNGKVLASNRPAFSALFLPGKQSDPAALVSLAKDLAPQLEMEETELYEDLRDAVKNQVPVKLAENLPARTMFRLSEMTPLYPGLELVVEARRYYPYGAFASHLLGYIGALDEKQWQQLKTKGYRADSRAGKTGLEKMLEDELRGTDGGLQLEVDAQGRLVRVLQKVPWTAGGDVELTIDADMQAAAEEGLKNSVSGGGAAVVLDPRNGEILALASVPDFDPNLFLEPKDTETQAAIQSLPEFDAALQGTFPPGSTFKPIVGAAALNEGRLDPDDKWFCPGYYDLRTRSFACWKPDGHGRMDWRHGLANSCDVYFYNVGLKIGAPLIEKYERLFRLGQLTYIPLPGEKKGHLFGPKSRGNRGWYDGDTLNLAIGQGELLVTPIQMASVYMALANRGTFFRPNFIRKVTSRSGEVEFEGKPEVLDQLTLKESVWDLLHEGLRAVVTEGTGQRLNFKGLDVYAKTGTAQNPGGEDHAWMCAFAGEPGQPPRLAMAVLVEHGGHGSEAAGPVAKRILEAAFKDEIEKGRKAAPEAAPAARPPAPLPAPVPAAQPVH